MPKISKLFLYTMIASVTMVGCFEFFSPSCVGDQCVASASKVDAPLPTPTPTPTPSGLDSSCEASCKVYSLTIDESVSVIPLNKTQEFNLTPYTQVNICDASGKPTGRTELVKTTKECDDGRAGEVSWKASTAALEITNLGFKAEVKRVGTGPSVLTVSLDGKSLSREIR